MGQHDHGVLLLLLQPLLPGLRAAGPGPCLLSLACTPPRQQGPHTLAGRHEGGGERGGPAQPAPEPAGQELPLGGGRVEEVNKVGGGRANLRSK